MTNAEAFRQIVQGVNASRNGTSTFRDMGAVAKWTRHHADDEQIILDSLVLTMKVGKGSPRERIRDDGKPADAADVQRVTRQVLDYIAD